MTPTLIKEQAPVPPPCYQRAQARLSLWEFESSSSGKKFYIFTVKYDTINIKLIEP